jgi:hypothetical protein
MTETQGAATMSVLSITLPDGTKVPFKVKISGVATVTNPPMSDFVLEEMKARYRKGLPDLPDYPLAPDIKRALDQEASGGS